MDGIYNNDVVRCLICHRHRHDHLNNSSFFFNENKLLKTANGTTQIQENQQYKTCRYTKWKRMSTKAQTHQKPGMILRASEGRDKHSYR